MTPIFSRSRSSQIYWPCIWRMPDIFRLLLTTPLPISNISAARWLDDLTRCRYLPMAQSMCTRSLTASGRFLLRFSAITAHSVIRSRRKRAFLTSWNLPPLGQMPTLPRSMPCHFTRNKITPWFLKWLHTWCILHDDYYTSIDGARLYIFFICKRWMPLMVTLLLFGLALSTVTIYSSFLRTIWETAALTMQAEYRERNSIMTYQCLENKELQYEGEDDIYYTADDSQPTMLSCNFILPRAWPKSCLLCIYFSSAMHERV